MWYYLMEGRWTERVKKWQGWRPAPENGTVTYELNPDGSGLIKRVWLKWIDSVTTYNISRSVLRPYGWVSKGRQFVTVYQYEHPYKTRYLNPVLVYQYQAVVDPDEVGYYHDAYGSSENYSEENITETVTRPPRWVSDPVTATVTLTPDPGKAECRPACILHHIIIAKYKCGARGDGWGSKWSLNRR